MVALRFLFFTRKACKDYIKKFGEVKVGQAVKTTAGNLRFKAVIHTVGPSWTGGNSNEPNLLKSAIISALKIAEAEKVSSIAFPAISAGIFNYPIEECAKILIASAFEFFALKPQLQKIRFVDKDPKIVNIIVEVMKHFGTPVVKESVDKNAKRSLFDILLSKKPATFTPKQQWYWQDDDESYVPYDPDQNYQIDLAYSQYVEVYVFLNPQEIENG